MKKFEYETFTTMSNLVSFLNDWPKIKIEAMYESEINNHLVLIYSVEDESDAPHVYHI